MFLSTHRKLVFKAEKLRKWRVFRGIEISISVGRVVLTLSPHCVENWFQNLRYDVENVLKSPVHPVDTCRYPCCNWKVRRSRWRGDLQYTPPRTCVLGPKIWRYRMSLKNPGTGAETHKWNFCYWGLSGFCSIFCRHQIKGTACP